MDWNSTANNSALGPVEAILAGADSILRWTEDLFRLDIGHSFLNVLSDFVDSVRWSEPFIVGVLVLQLIMLAVAVHHRRNQKVQAALFLVIAAVVFGANALNGLAKDHWPIFATQDYFDSQGLFMALFVSGPLLMTANVIVFNLFGELLRAATRASRARARVSADSVRAKKGN